MPLHARELLSYVLSKATVIASIVMRWPCGVLAGASSGIGVGIAVLFARLGSQVALTGRDEENLRKTAAECASQPDAKQARTVGSGRPRCAATVGNWRRQNAQIDQNADRSPLASNWSRSNASALMSVVTGRKHAHVTLRRAATSRDGLQE